MAIEIGRSATGWKVCEPRAVSLPRDPTSHVSLSPCALPVPLGTLNSYLSQMQRG